MTNSPPNQKLFESLVELAQRAYHANDFERSESFCRRALELDERGLPALLLLGFCSARTKRLKMALDLFEQVLRIDEACVEAHIALCNLLVQSGNFEAAALHGLRAVEIEPDDHATISTLARTFASKERHLEAIVFFKRLVMLEPNNLVHLRNLATAQIRGTQSRPSLGSSAIQTLETVVRLNPKSAPDLHELGRLYLSTSRPLDAIATSERLVKLNSKDRNAHMLAAMAFAELGETKSAEKEFREVLRHSPDDPLVLASLGLALQEQGRFDEAREPIEESIKLWPSNGLAYYTLVRSTKVTEEHRSLIESMERALQGPLPDRLHQAYLHYALGKSLEDLEEYERSFAEYDEANRHAYQYWRSQSPWDRERYKSNFDRTIEVFDRRGIARLQPAERISERPLFVVGMMRSGTTLVEQILSSHPEVAAGGELSFWHDHAGRIFDADSGSVKQDELHQVAREYLDLLSRFSTHSARVTDKLPHNYALIGIIKAAIPGARFIRIRRNAIDNCLSVYTTALARPPGFANDKANIVFAYQQLERIMSHWRETLSPTDLLEIDYEDLVANREAVTRKMIEFSGLEWSDECLHHQRNTRTVHTPSMWQVRQPIYRTSIDRWRRFEPWLGEFLELG